MYCPECNSDSLPVVKSMKTAKSFRRRRRCRVCGHRLSTEELPLARPDSAAVAADGIGSSAHREGPVVFICYAREDREQVLDIYRELWVSGFRPRMDRPPPGYAEQGILPGTLWDVKIRDWIKSADFFLACLSRDSVSKCGYVQKEYRFALSQVASRPSSEVYLIPVLLVDCEPPGLRVDEVDFHSIQWFPLFKDGVGGLISLLQEHSRRRKAKSRSEDNAI